MNSGKDITMRFTIILLVFAFSSIYVMSVNAGTFFDDFDDGKDDGWAVFEGNWELVDGEYRAPDEINAVPYPLTFALDGEEYGPNASRLVAIGWK